MNKIVKELEVAHKPKEYIVNKLSEPDIWVQPKVVLEILADEITVSPRHTTGYSLRFPRLIRFREDKGPEETTTVSEVKKLYKMQHK
jgi:DNA ligase-1